MSLVELAGGGSEGGVIDKQLDSDNAIPAFPRSAHFYLLSSRLHAVYRMVSVNNIASRPTEPAVDTQSTLNVFVQLSRSPTLPLRDGPRSAAEALCSENHQASVLRCISCTPLMLVCIV